MSLLARSRHALASSRTAGPSVSAIQTRGYAAPKKGASVKQQRQGYKKRGQGEGGVAASKKDKPLGAFMPLPPGRLEHPLFESQNREVLNLPTFRPEVLTETMSAGKALAFPKTENNPLKVFGVPKNLLVEYRILSNPCSVVRDVTLKTVDVLDGASQKSSLETRAVLTGPSGCGKSVLLLQSVSYALAKGWAVLYIPRAANLVNSTTEYVYDARTRTYLQPSFSYEILRRFSQVNINVLTTLKITKDFVAPNGMASLAKGANLQELVNIGTTEKSLAPQVLEALLAELGAQKDFPVLLAVDDFQSLYSTSLYRNPRFEAIKSWHLSLPRLILEYAGGKKHFSRGAVLGALSHGHTTFQTPLELAEALSLPQSYPSLAPEVYGASPYTRRIPELAEYAKGLKRIDVPASLGVEEAAGVFEVWMKDKALHSVANDELFMHAYAGAGGNARDFVWRGLLSTFTL